VDGSRVVEVTLQGRSFTLRTSEDPARLGEVVEYANARLDEVGSGSGMNPHSASLLTVLTLAEELLREREARARLRERVTAGSARILAAAGTALRTEG
jgi:cell division protein ZapA (FtsZ GTPase activity inhibitor)